MSLGPFTVRCLKYTAFFHLQITKNSNAQVNKEFSFVKRVFNGSFQLKIIFSKMPQYYFTFPKYSKKKISLNKKNPFSLT